MTGAVDAFDSVAVNVMGEVPLSPSITVGSEIEIDGGGATSSLVMVPIAMRSDRVTPEGFDKVTMKVSLGSATVSPRTPTVTVFEVWPAAKVSVPEAAV